MFTVEHFDGGALPAPWTAIVAGTGTVTVSDSNAVCTLAASGDAAAFAKPFDHTRSQIVLACGRQDTGTTPHPSVQLVHAASTPVADIRANVANLIRCLTYVTTSDYLRVNYTDTGGTTRNWRDSDKSWQTGGSIISAPAATPRDDYRIHGFQWDAENARVRLVGMHTAAGSIESIAHGPRIQILTDWVDLSSIRDGTSTTLWLVLGWPETNFFAAASSAYFEWVAESWGNPEYVLSNGKATSGNYSIQAHVGFDLRSPYLLPAQRETQAIPVGTSGAYDDDSTQWGSIFRDDDGVYVASYSAGDGSTVTIGLATATDPAGTWTKQGQILALGPGGSYYENQYSFNVLTKDWSEPDPTKRYKLIVRGYDASVAGRILLFYGASRTGPFTYDGELIPADGTETGIAYRGQPVWYRGRWWLFYNCTVAGAGVIRAAHSTTLRAGTFTKLGVTLNTQSVGSVEQAVVAISGRVVTVGDTTGFVRDMEFVATNSASTDAYAISRVRKVLGGTQFEAYHSMPGVNTSSVIRSGNFGTDNALNQVLRLGDKWHFVMTAFKVFTTHPTFGAHHEANALFEGGASPFDPMAILHQSLPIAPFGTEAAKTSISCENLRVCRPVIQFASPAPVVRRARSPLTRR